MKSETQSRRDIVEVCKRIHSRGWISSTDGNVSVRLSRDKILITPTGIHKGYMSERDVIVVDMDGKLVAGARKPSTEIVLHLTCYRERPDVNAVVHAHPTMCVAFSLAGVSLAKCLLPEVIFTLGSIPTAEYAAPTTVDVAESVKSHIKDFDAVILARHGSVTVGADVFGAYNTLERMEHVAEITFHARQIGNIKPLTSAQIENLQAIGEKMGWPKKKIITDMCNSCNACGKFNECAANGEAALPPAPGVNARVEEMIAEEVRAELLKRSS
jgi:L-fuculose-phosphate aldolase